MIEKYDLQELKKKLENIKYGLDDKLNFPKAFYTLILEIQEIKELLKNDIQK